MACLLFVTNRPTGEIEAVLTQYMPSKDAAGAIRNTTSRTCDLLPTVTRIAEILHPELELEHRLARLLARLDIGVPAAATDLAIQAGARLSRGDYLRLLEFGLCDVNVLENKADEEILPYIDDNSEKLAVVRQAIEAHRQQEEELKFTSPILEPYEG